MSATGRSDVREPNDNYPTPAWCVTRLRERVSLAPGHWLDPCAGDGAIIRASGVPLGVTWHGVELRNECASSLGSTLNGTRPVIGDFLDPRVRERVEMQTKDRRFSVILTNPPYALAMNFLAECLPIADRVVFLLRVGFLESEKRHAFLKNHIPNVYILPNRPSFVGKSTDATTYAWMVFYPTPRTAGRIELLDLTPDTVRRR